MKLTREKTIKVMDLIHHMLWKLEGSADPDPEKLKGGYGSESGPALLLKQICNLLFFL